ncbi:MAG: hypothetical protein KatS3mg031_0750 [Chitinophagales bacterium]|nr:MAG: hypothetical protein KatS3mg031_0750 [Chitinophagales bacterium]
MLCSYITLKPLVHSIILQLTGILFFLGSCAGNASGQIQSFFVKPSATDVAYAEQDSHLVVYNNTLRIHKLLLFIGGTFSSPKHYAYFAGYAASLGFDVISLTYPNSVLTTLLAGSSDSLAFNKFRQEICFGTPLSPWVNVDSLNSIYTRTVKLLRYLDSAYPAHNWAQYLSAPDSPDWSQIILSGHSQGSGHACYLSKLYAAERVVMFSGPNDYSTYYSRPAPWLSEQGQTPAGRYYVFLHLQDEIVPFERQYANIAALGMLIADDTTCIDQLTPPFLNSHCLYSNSTISGSPHNAPVIYPDTPLDNQGNPLFGAVWRYMLLEAIPASAAVSKKPQLLYIYPNPTTTLLCIKLFPERVSFVRIYSASGTLMGNYPLKSNPQCIAIRDWPAGLYYVQVKDAVTRLIISR